MLQRLIKILFVLPIMAISSGYAVTCQSNEFEYNGECIESKFEITTTNDTSKFVFNMTAKGTFYIDWGDGNVQMINRTNTTMTEYSHNYASANEYIIKFGGRATGYISGEPSNSYYNRGACIYFGAADSRDSAHVGANNTYDKLAGISGSLGAIFPTIGTGGTNTNQPRFMSTFRDCINLTGSIPPDLFLGITGKGVHNMFSITFSGCSALTDTNIDDPNNPGKKYAIPPTLFSGLTNVSGAGLFLYTFRNCSGLTGTIPGSLFNIQNISASAQSMFHSTFIGCSGLSGPIPANLFANVSGKAGSYLFYYTFSGCSGLSGTNIDDPNNPGMKYAIPPNLFAGITGAAASTRTGIFQGTFSNCSGLTGTIPSSLFANFYSVPTDSMFTGLFQGCSGLTGAIPADLFSSISGAPMGSVFSYTFRNCSSLSNTNIDDPNNPGKKYAIPPTLFSGISGAPAGYMFRNTFSGCSGLTGTIPGSLFSGISGAPAEDMFDSTFYNCSGLTGSIPSGLFSGVSGAPADSMFYCTFYGCSSLTGSIPGNLFSGISGVPAVSMFNSTFYGCSGLNGTDIDDLSQPGYKYAIPPTLFSGISGAPAKQMFQSTFQSCPGLTGTIPENLFAGVYGKPAPGMFLNTFYGCSGLIGSIPGNLFSSVSGAPESSMFQATFRDCSSLTGPLPGDLFAGIYGKASTQSFYYTFYNCTNLGKNAISGTNTYYIPPELFAGLDTTSSANSFMSNIFAGTGLRTSCPAGTSQYITGFESKWGTRKSCTECPVVYPNYDSDTQQCYAQVAYVDSDNGDLLKTEYVYYDGNNGSGYTLPSYSPVKPDTILDNWENGSGTVIAANDVLTGNQVVYSDWAFNCDSGKYFHLGNNSQMCVAETKQTDHALVINVDPEHTYYIHATPNSEHDYTINSSSAHKLKANYNGTIYNLHDASVYFSD